MRIVSQASAEEAVVNLEYDMCFNYNSPRWTWDVDFTMENSVSYATNINDTEGIKNYNPSHIEKTSSLLVTA